MFFSSLKKGLFKILFSPWVLLVFAAVSILGLFIGNVVFWAIERPVMDLILYYDSLEQANFLFIILTQYPLEIITLLITGLVGLVVSATGLISLSRMAKGDSFIDSINESVVGWRKSVALAIFFLAAVIILVAILYVLGVVTGIISGIMPSTGLLVNGIIFPIVMGIILAFLMVKLGFIIPALVENDLRKALQKSWKFTNKRFVGAFVLMIVLIIVMLIVESVGNTLSLMVSEEYAFSVVAVADVLSTTFVALVLSYYYFAEEN